MVVIKSAQIRYHKMCLNQLLPTAYTTMDLSRLSLIYFNLTSLALLDALPENKPELIEAIYRVQHPRGGFRSSTTTVLPLKDGELPGQWDPANIPATYFALCSLLVLGDDLSRVNRDGFLEGLRTHQTSTGGWGELLWGPDLERENTDLRFVFSAVASWYILKGGNDAFDVQQAAEFVRKCETFDHGFSKYGGWEEGHGECVCFEFEVKADGLYGRIDVLWARCIGVVG